MKKKIASKKEIFKAEGFLHLFFHLSATILLILSLAVLPLKLAFLVICLEIFQLWYFKGCFLTVLAHKRGYMSGMTFWQYVPYVFGIKNYKVADKVISYSIRVYILVVFIFRFIFG